MEKKDLKIVYMGTPDFAVEPLKKLVEGGYNIVGVITMPDKPIGRHQTELSQSPVKQYAVSQGIKVLQPERLKDEVFIEELRSLNADLQIVVAFRMLPEVVWQMPRLGTFNLHASLLPRYRGAAPINWAIINGDKETGITTFFLQHAIDTGNVIQQVKIPITEEDNAESIHDRLMILGGELVVETVDNIINEEVTPIPQEEIRMEVSEQQRQAPKIFKETCKIDWTLNAKKTFDFIRGLSPYPGAWSEFVINGKNQVLKVFKSHIVSQQVIQKAETKEVGELFSENGHLYVVQHDALQELDTIQLAGKKRMSAADFLRGIRLAIVTLIITLACLMGSPMSAQKVFDKALLAQRAEIERVIGKDNVDLLKPIDKLIDGKSASQDANAIPRNFKNITILNSEEAGFVVLTNDEEPIVLAYGDNAIDPDNVSPEFMYMMEQYDQQIENGILTSNSLKSRKRKVQYINVSPMLTTTWAQSSPYNSYCPLYEGTGNRCLAGCVAVSMGQVLNYYKLPKSMRGYKKYTYTTKGNKRMTYGMNFRATTFNWSGMANKLNSFSTNTAKEAVGRLLYACGIASNMYFDPSSSATYSYHGAEGISNLMDGLQAYTCSFDEDVIIRELQNGHPVIYGGEKSSGEGHSFVIDGVRSDGYYHCNLGWGGSSDGYYLPTNMNGYNIRHDMMIIHPDNSLHTCTPIDDLKNKYAHIRWNAATDLKIGKWYVMWSVGANSSPYARGNNQTIFTRSIMPAGESTIYNADQLVRLARAENEQVYLQMGTGEYIGAIEAYNKKDAKGNANPTAAYTYGSISPGYFYLRNNGCNLDAADASMLLTGWSMAIPTDTLNTSIWQFYPVAIAESPITDPNQIPDYTTEIPEFDNAQHYLIKNTGYSQGYLVALNSTDEHPTLRGVTQDHTNGLYNGALYHDEVDLSNPGSYWNIITEDNKQYIRNALTGKYLTNSGPQTCYIFTDTKTAIRIGEQNNSTCYWINASEDTKSYLCAATHLVNPAAFWEQNDNGSYWTIEPAEIPEPQEPLPIFDSSKFYTIRSATEAGAYLTAISRFATDVTVHGAANDSEVASPNYKQEAELNNAISYWKITTENEQLFIQNCLNDKYLTTSSSTPYYYLTSLKLPINIGSISGSEQTYWINALNDPNKCLSLDLLSAEYPAAQGEKTSIEAHWFIEPHESMSATTVILGDVNADKEINVGDLTALVSYILNTEQPTYIRKAADLNGDDEINVTDYTLLVNKILGN